MSSTIARLGAVGAVLFATIAAVGFQPREPDSPSLADAHVHLSLGPADALERLASAGVTVVRDCGGDIDQLTHWRDEIAAGKRRGPRIFLAGPLIDGPKPGAMFRLTIRTPEDAVRAVDSLTGKVDFLKTHNAIPPETFFALVRRARERGLKVAAHLPVGVPAWTAAEAGVGSIEHAAESLAASPVYAGVAKDLNAAIDWWRSADGDAAIRRLVASKVTVVPTLVRYEAMIDAPANAEARSARAAALPKLIELVGRLHRAGVPLLVGSDLNGIAGGPSPETGPAREMQLLEAAGLSAAEAREAASPAALERWFRER
jgi:imidazolonepropionase-like amidohydrolase